MDEHYADRNILMYRLYALFNEPLFWGPILITSLQKLAHMPLSDIYYMESAVLCICVALDIPSGALADIIGRKRSIIIGRVFLIGSAFFFTIMTTPLDAWIGNILWAIGYTMQSGADTALLYDTLKEHGRQAEYKRVEGQAIGSRLILIAFCSLLTGLLATVDLRLPLWLCLPFIIIPLVAAFFFKEPARTEHYSVQKQIEVLKQGVIFAIRSLEVRWM
ncbi:MAG: MFS transporter, partial [bacterium]|nr:MFS transporter [bacterium]